MSRAEDQIAALDSKIAGLERELTRSRSEGAFLLARATKAEADLHEAQHFAKGLARDLEAARAGAIRAEVESTPETPEPIVNYLRNLVPFPALEAPEARAALHITGGDVKRAEALVFLIRRLR